MLADAEEIQARARGLHAVLLALVAAALAPMIALAVLTHIQDREQEANQAVEHAAHGARMVAQNLAQQTRTARLFLELMATTRRVRSCERKNCSEALAEFAALAPEYQNLILARPDGSVLASAKPLPGGESLSGDTALQEALAVQGFAVGVADFLPGGAAVRFVAPVHNEAGGVGLLVAAQLSLSEMAAPFDAAGLPEGSTLVLATQKGRILYRIPEAGRYAGTRLSDEHSGILSHGPEEASGWSTGMDGVERFYVMRRLNLCQGEACYVRVGIPKSAVYAASSAKLSRNLIALAATTLLALVLTRLWGSRRVLAPMEKLTQAATALGQGDFHARTGISGEQGGDLGLLARTFDSMAEGLERREAEREEARRALLESEDRLRAIFNASSDGLLLLVPDGRVLAMNEAAARRRNKTAAELTGRNILELIPEEVRNGRRERFLEVARTGAPLRFEEEREGRTYAIRLYPILAGNGEVIQIASFSRDVTERKIAERTLLSAKDAAEAADKAKSAFLANMSHELRTPLNGLLGMLRLMASDPGPEELHEYIAWAQRSAQQITDLLNDILDFAALSGGSMPFVHRPFTLGEVFSDLEQAFGPVCEAKGIALNLRADPGLLRQPLAGDPGRLALALRHLTDNAVKFTDQGAVALMAKEASRDEASLTLRISVQDTGMGIRPEDMGRVLQPFVQGESPLTKSHPGTGLGLAIVRGLAEQLGGEVQVQSVPGQGSCFTLHVTFQTPSQA